MIKAVIFDFFGVLAVRGVGSFSKTYYPNDAEKIKLTEDLQDKLNLGTLGYDGYIDGLAKVGGVGREEVLRYTEDYKANAELLDCIQRELKPKYKIGIISNAGDDWVDEVLGSDTKLFDDIVLSYKVGIIKPEPEIYEISTKNLGVRPEEAVFIDDILKYCQGAEAVGMNTIWYKDFDQFKTELETILASGTN